MLRCCLHYTGCGEASFFKTEYKSKRERLLNNNLFPDIPRESVRVHSLPPIVHIMSFLRRRLCENTLISPEGVDYSPGRSPGFFGLRNRRNILAPAHTFERSRSKVWAGAFCEDVCLCRVPRTASWAIFSVLHFVPDFLATAGHSAPFHTAFAGMTIRRAER